MQTEMHHVRTLKLMAGVYARELRDALQMGGDLLDRLFPRLEDLLKIHVGFLSSLRQRRRDSLEPGGERNYVVQRLGDILVLQVGVLVLWCPLVVTHSGACPILSRGGPLFFF